MDQAFATSVSVVTQEYVNLLKFRVDKELNRLKNKYNPDARPKFSLEMPRAVFDCIFGNVINDKDCIKEDLNPILGDKWWEVIVYAEKDSDVISGYYGMVGQLTLTSTGELRNTFGNLQ